MTVREELKDRLNDARGKAKAARERVARLEAELAALRPVRLRADKFTGGFRIYANEDRCLNYIAAICLSDCARHGIDPDALAAHICAYGQPDPRDEALAAAAKCPYRHIVDQWLICDNQEGATGDAEADWHRLRVSMWRELLDPQISEEAAKLVQRGRDEALATALTALSAQIQQERERREKAEREAQRMKASTQWDTVQTINEQLSIAESDVRVLTADRDALAAKLAEAEAELARLGEVVG